MKTEERFKAYLRHQGYDQADVAEHALSFSYRLAPIVSDGGNTANLEVPFHYCPTRKAVHEKHLQIWNQSSTAAFVAVGDDFTWVIDGRSKPSQDPNSEPEKIDGYGYGINNFELDTEIRKKLGREQVDFGFFFDFVIQRQKQQARTVDRDLLINLLALKRDLLLDGLRDEDVHLLLLRCLFVKFLEDRGVFPEKKLETALQTSGSKALDDLFGLVKRLNGDLFGQHELNAAALSQNVLGRLWRFFGHFDYQSGEGKIFPYQFDQIPIQLIGSIYESFLNDQTKKDSGIYYTPRHLVQFVLSRSLGKRLESSKNVTLLDPACGSGAFLVEGFKMLIEREGARNDFEAKKRILESQIFGMDLDSRALQITAFSLYLELLNGEDSETLQAKIKDKETILPHLIGKTLVRTNSLLQVPQFVGRQGQCISTFDCIVANPPWGDVPTDSEADNIKMRQVFGASPTDESYPMYRGVVGFQRSQAFLLRAASWCNAGSTVAMVLNNAIFLNGEDIAFRQALLQTLRLESFYEMSGINNILFKREKVGSIGGEDIYVGADEPCAVAFLQYPPTNDHPVRYVRPVLNRLTRALKLIAYGSSEVVEAQNADLLAEDRLWRIFARGGWADYQLIQKRIYARDKAVLIKAPRGFQPSKSGNEGATVLVPLIDLQALHRYNIDSKLLKFYDSARANRRPINEEFSKGTRILIDVRPKALHGLRLWAARYSEDAVNKDNIIAVKIDREGDEIENYAPYLAILNSKFVGYLSCFGASQWRPGDKKRPTLRTTEIEQLPFPVMDAHDARVQELGRLVEQVEQRTAEGKSISKLEADIDALVYDLYGLTLYERMVVDEFFQVNVGDRNLDDETQLLFGASKHVADRPKKRSDLVSAMEMKKYLAQFSETVGLVLRKGFELKGRFNVSPNLGALACFSIYRKGEVAPLVDLPDMLAIVKQFQMKGSFISNQLQEEKIKYYDKEKQLLYIIKTNHFRDWTERKAIDDANEEIAEMLQRGRAR